MRTVLGIKNSVLSSFLGCLASTILDKFEALILTMLVCSRPSSGSSLASFLTVLTATLSLGLEGLDPEPFTEDVEGFLLCAE